jgi:hypothetical protein
MIKSPIYVIISLNSSILLNSVIMTFKRESTTVAIVFVVGLGLLINFVGQALAATAIERTARTQWELIPSLAQDQNRIPGSLSGIANDHGTQVSAIAHPVTN